MLAPPSQDCDPLKQGANRTLNSMRVNAVPALKRAFFPERCQPKWATTETCSGGLSKVLLSASLYPRAASAGNLVYCVLLYSRSARPALNHIYVDMCDGRGFWGRKKNT